MTPLEKLFWDDLGEMLHSKEMLLKAFFRMEAAAAEPRLKEALGLSRTEAQHEAEEIKELFRLAKAPARSKKCDAMMGMLLKGQHLMIRIGPGPVLDSALLSLCRRIAAYNVDAWTNLVSWARLSGGAQHKAFGILPKLARGEAERVVRFARLTESCDQAAAGEEQFSAPKRRPAARSDREDRAFAGNF